MGSEAREAGKYIKGKHSINAVPDLKTSRHKMMFQLQHIQCRNQHRHSQRRLPHATQEGKLTPMP